MGSSATIIASESINRKQRGRVEIPFRQGDAFASYCHTMIAVTYMMLPAEAYGFDTAPTEGFDPAGVKTEFGIPDEAEVLALLAIGRAAEAEKPYPGRFSLAQIVYDESCGQSWRAGLSDLMESFDSGAFRQQT